MTTADMSDLFELPWHDAKVEFDKRYMQHHFFTLNDARIIPTIVSTGCTRVTIYRYLRAADRQTRHRWPSE
jgi:hypothetical protein